MGKANGEQRKMHVGKLVLGSGSIAHIESPYFGKLIFNSAKIT